MKFFKYAFTRPLKVWNKHYFWTKCVCNLTFLLKECFRRRLRIEYDVPKGSILVPLLSKKNSTDMFCEYSEDSHIENYADDTPWYACASDIITVISELQVTTFKLLTWFNNKHMKADTEKSYFIWVPKLWKKLILVVPW